LHLRVFPAVAAAICALPAVAQNPALTRILAEELHRNYEALRKTDPAPYFISYEVFDTESDVASASFGALNGHSQSRNRTADVSVRAGSPKLDNTHRIGNERGQFTASTMIPVEDDAAAIRRRLWLATDQAYRVASQRFAQVETAQRTRADAEDPSDDFSLEPATTFVEAAKPQPAITPEWLDRLRGLSAVFGKFPEVLHASISLVVQRETKRLVTTEDIAIEEGRDSVRIMITAAGKAPDGMDLATNESFEAETLAGLPPEIEIRAAVERTARYLAGLVKAPVVEPFTGPAILSGRAAGVFFHEIFGHRVEGHRQKDESEGQTFTKSVGEPVLPAFLSVVFDPTRDSAAGVRLNGSYRYDDEGVKARPVTVVDKGILKTFLLSRSPIRGFPSSNGHGRKQQGYDAVSRQSNLIVEAAESVPEARLREMLREQLKRQNKPYGLYFTQVTGGYTTTGRAGLQAFTVMPLVVYRVYADGRPDELVRGVDIVGTPLQSFAKIAAAGDRPEVFNGVCGAESGGVPVSAVSPAILITELEVQRKERSMDRPPYLGAPTLEGK
jgi:predicted Zn-dependent protease